MDRTERFYKIEQLLHARKLVSVETFLYELGVSRATFKRDLEYLRDRLHAPIEWDRIVGGYRFAEGKATSISHELPGLWFNASEIYALLSMQHLLSTIEPGLLAPQIEPLKTRLMSILAQDHFTPTEITDRIKLVHALKRPITTKCFEQIASATLKRQRLLITHFHREKNESVAREVSPQQLVYYHNNWYLDAWCHLRNAIRSFAVDAITTTELLDKPARGVSKSTLKEHFEQGYGIFGGNNVQWVKLKFTAERARWVSKEIWHPEQKSHVEPDGSYVLEIPVSDDREIIMEILKHGDQVTIMAPATLKRKVRDTLKRSLDNYEKVP
jgi:predicted DNA-binding transcriptional regulator YafY